jgi:hypothetical protein
VQTPHNHTPHHHTIHDDDQHSVANITTVYSHEQPRGELLPLTAEQETNPKVCI